MKVKTTVLEETIQATYNPDAYLTRCNTGWEQIAEGSKLSLKTAARQNAFFMTAITKALSGSLLPNPFGLGLGGQALEGFVTMQKNMLDMALEQGSAVIEAMEESGKNATSVVQQSLTAAQKEIAEAAVNPVNTAAANSEAVR